MFSTFSHRQISARARLLDGMLRDRGRQFVDRHGWPLARDPQGREIDNFDRTGTTYCLVHDGDSHLASLRLRPADDASMAAALCPDLWRTHAAALSNALEVTRFCCRPGAGRRAHCIHTVELLQGLCRHGVASRRPHLFGLVFPAVARAIRRSGWASETLGRFELDGRDVLLCTWTCDSVADWHLQERLAQLETAPVDDAVQKVA